MKRTVMTVLLMAAVCCAGESHARTYRFAWVPWLAWSPLHVAEANGFWKEQGLDVKLIKCSDPIDALKLFSEKRIDLLMDMIGSSAGYYLEGMPVVILAETDWSHGGDKIILKKDVSPSNLKGKPVGVYLNRPSVTYFLNRWLSTVGMKLSDVKTVEMETKPMTDNFINGMFDLIVCYDPEALRAEKEGMGNVVMTSAFYEGCIPEGITAMKDILAGIPKKDLAGILKGWIKGVNWINDPANQKAYLEIINSRVFTGEKPYAEKDIQEMLGNVRIHDANTLMERNRDGGGLASYLKDLKLFLQENGMLTKDFAAEDIFDNSAIIEILKNGQ